MSEIKPHSCSAEAIAQEIADNTPHGKKTDTYARIYQGAYFGAVRAFEESSASLNRASDACASVQKERDALRDFMEEAKRLLGQISKSDWASIEEMKGIGIELGPESTVFAREIDAFLARYEGGR